MAIDQTKVVPPPPYKVPMYERPGELHAMWSHWFKQVFLRIGQEIALSNVELENIQQEDLTDIQADIVALQSGLASAVATNNTQNTRLTALEAEVEGLRLEPVA